MRYTWLPLLFFPAMLNAQAVPKEAAPAPKLSPAEAWKSFTIADDLRWDQVLAEPTVRQPLSLNFDEKGRLWVVQYLQYPFPAGLKVVSRDKYWRVVYDKVPPPPPNHFPGKDRITIHEDTNGDGRFDRHTTFLEGLNIATAAVRGRGGVWVLNPPYLLFYPTENNADHPTGPPVVHLQGFGMEDCHSVVNSLRFGPDGWLYASQGSTVTANVVRPGTKDKPIQTVGQNIWRYHPAKKIFEVFAEGGGNAFGVEIDDQGRIFSGHNGGDTRGFHYVQGGYYRKGFEKHGVLSNPFAFGFFEAMKHNKAQRFSHTFVINESSTLPAKYRGQLFAVAPLQSHVMLSEVVPDRSSLQTRDLGPVVLSKDPWFRPVDIKMGPDGALYVADFYEDKIAHLRHYEGQIDTDTGRIYRLTAKDARPLPPFDLNRKTSAELVELLKSDNRWQRQTVQRLLGDRRDAQALPPLLDLLKTGKGQAALEALWGIHNSGKIPPDLHSLALRHPEPLVRAWTVRLQGDENQLGSTLAAEWAQLAEREDNVTVRCQLATSARRLPAAEALPVLRNLLLHEEDAKDIHLPLLLWWGFERHAGLDRDAVLNMFRESSPWRGTLAEDTVLPRLMRRFASAGTLKDLAACTELFRLAPEKKYGLLLLKGFEEAFKGRSSSGLPKELLAEIAKLGGGSLAFGVRQGNSQAVDKALAIIQDPKATFEHRLELIDTLGEARQPRCVPVLLKLFADADKDEIRKASLQALQAYQDPQIGKAVVERYAKLSGELKEVAETLLSSRREWTHQWLLAVDEGRLPVGAIPRGSVRQLLLVGDESLKALLRKHWGDLKGATTAEIQQEIDRVLLVLAQGAADPLPGKKLFQERCATCHALHGQGGQVGPDLTTYKRDDVANLLLHIVNPSAEIREGFENQVVVTDSGRTLTGILIEKDARVVVLRTADNQKVTLPKEEIELLRAAGASLMPEGLLQELKDQDLRDLFAYLRTNQPLNYKK